MKRRHPDSEGFSLVELMIVVSVVAVISAISIPLLINGRMRANEGSAVSSLRTITSGNNTYKTRFGVYATDLSDLSDAEVIDTVLGGATALPGKSGYLFVYTGSRNVWEAEAHPVTPGASGQRYFFVDTSGVIRSADGEEADTTSEPIDG